MNMRLLGVTSLDQLRPEMVDASAIRAHVGLQAGDNLYNSICTYCRDLVLSGSVLISWPI